MTSHPETAQGHAKAGRPRGFDEAQALESALSLFWRKGYEQSSLAELLEVTGLARTSLYRTFGDKRQLFARAVEHYGELIDRALAERIEAAPTPIGGVLAIFDLWREQLASQASTGCLIFNSLGEFGSAEDEPLRQLAWRNLERVEQRFRGALQAAADAGELPAGADVDHLTSVMLGTGQAVCSFGRYPEQPGARRVVDGMIASLRELVGQP